MHVNPSDDEIWTLLETSKTIAMGGASSKPDRPSHGVMSHLQRAGYRVIPVNPNETEVLGEKAYRSLEDLTESIDIVDVFRRAEDTPPIADQAVKIGARAFWLQQGIVSEAAASRAEAGGLTVVMDRCLAVAYVTLLGV
ncbi:MAG: CoA-binding protein [Chloroflexi bacterium]|nr:CoA-binding protein [Chloroflexota bacterium]